MRALLLAAGEGTRLRPLTEAIPKCLVPIAGVPLLQTWIWRCEEMKIEKALINTSYKSEMVHQFLSHTQSPVQLQSVHEAQLLGTAGTLFENSASLRGHDVLVVHADNFSVFSGQDFLNQFQTREAGVDGTLMSFDTESPKTCGILELDSRGRILKMHEKVENPPGKLANGAVYIFSRNLIDRILSGKRVSEISTEILPSLMGHLNRYHNSICHRDVGQISEYLKANREALTKKLIPRTISAGWSEIADDTLWDQWVRVWQQTGRKLKVCSVVGDLSRECINLLQEVKIRDLDLVSDFLRANTNTDVVIWRRVA